VLYTVMVVDEVSIN